MNTLGKKLAKINLRGEIRWDEPMSKHTTFQIGGPAQAMFFPASIDDIKNIRTFCKTEQFPLFVLGMGANLLVSDKGIPGIVLNLSSLADCRFGSDQVSIFAGTEVSKAVESCLEFDRSGLEFLYGMPGSIGGAVWMNARCYGAEIADIFQEALVLDENNEEKVIAFSKSEWAYKASPFQKKDWLILEARFKTKPEDPAIIRSVMENNQQDRIAKGHFKLPSAGSIFKNNHDFGKPSGTIIDELGLKGLRIGDAGVSLWHANIFVNYGHATAQDMYTVIQQVKEQVLQKTGFTLEEEVLYVGEW